MIALLAALAVTTSAAAGSPGSKSSPCPTPTDGQGAQPSCVVLDVPYLPQTDLLCGGAAAAMVFRYWGDRHADARPFLSLVDRRAGGIGTDVLTDAIRARNWQAVSFAGTIERLRTELAEKHPIILLVGDRPGRYHYVVAVGVDGDRVIVHDPEWGPSRRLAIDAFMPAWQAANFWALRVLPADGPQAPAVTRPPANPTVSIATTETAPSSTCDRALNDTLADIKSAGIDRADDRLNAVRAACPEAAAPIAELAGVRFAQRRYDEASALATDALTRDGHNDYAWDVLGSSCFMRDDLHGALNAWNHIGKPRVDFVAIDGLGRTRYALVAETLSLEPNTLLTDAQFRAAERRLQDLPDAASSRIGFRPGPDGFAAVDVVIVEARTLPRTVVEWTVSAASTYTNQEIKASFPGGAGQGALWNASWRWWANRPRVGVSFAAPRVAGVPGTWRVDAAWSVQTFAEVSSVSTIAPVRQDQVHGGVHWSNWLGSHWRYELSAGADAWDRGRPAASFGATLEPRFFDDRLSAWASYTRWTPLSGGDAFHSMALGSAIRSSLVDRGFVGTADVGAESASAAAPLSIWPGAGDGHARAFLLRAHPLLHDGIIDGPVFGRQIVYANGQVERWFDGLLSRTAVAVFVDAASASGRFPHMPGTPFQVDAGAGLRFRMPLQLGTFRVDLAHGVRDGTNAMTWGWGR